MKWIHLFARFRTNWDISSIISIRVDLTREHKRASGFSGFHKCDEAMHFIRTIWTLSFEYISVSSGTASAREFQFMKQLSSAARLLNQRRKKSLSSRHSLQTAFRMYNNNKYYMRSLICHIKKPDVCDRWCDRKIRTTTNNSSSSSSPTNIAQTRAPCSASPYAARGLRCIVELHRASSSWCPPR